MATAKKKPSAAQLAARAKFAAAAKAGTLRRKNPAKPAAKTQTIKGVKYTRKAGSTTVKYPFNVEAEGPAGFGSVAGFTSFDKAETYARAYAKMVNVRVRVMGK